jgi:hypothetical protein
LFASGDSFVGFTPSSGNVTDEMLKQYIEQQGAESQNASDFKISDD